MRAIADVLDPALNLERLPATARLFADLHNEDSVAVKRAKAYFKRERPFHAEPKLDVCDDAHDLQNSYPSGHAMMGYAAAGVLAQPGPRQGAGGAGAGGGLCRKPAGLRRPLPR